METKIYYIQNTNELDEALENIENNFPCFVNREFIEMNYSKIEIQFRNEDAISIDKILTQLVQKETKQ